MKLKCSKSDLVLRWQEKLRAFRDVRDGLPDGTRYRTAMEIKIAILEECIGELIAWVESNE